MTTRVELIHAEQHARVRFVGDKGIQLLSADTRDQLADALTELESRTDCRVVVFEAAGRTFIAGADINELQSLDAQSAAACSRETHALFDRIERLPAVTIAAIHAACAGGGFELALACDIRLAAESAKIGLPEVTLGLIPGWGGTVRVTRMFGPAVARALILSGELLPARTALAWGLVQEVEADDAFADLVQRRVDTYRLRSPAAVQTAKRLVRELCGADGDPFAMESRAFGDCYDSPEAQEGIAAFLEKRPASWRSTDQANR
jgi:enoyl-CoA hydratase/carnithine racemase